MEAAYQTSDFEMNELGDLSVDAFVEEIRDKDWTRDLKILTGRMHAQVDYCQPNFNARIDDRTTVMIVPSENDQYTIEVRQMKGWKWFASEKEHRFLDATIDDVKVVLTELVRGNFKELLRRYSAG